MERKDFIKTLFASLVGATVVLCADIAKDLYLNIDARKLKNERKERLTIMLCDPSELQEKTGLWRDLKTLSRVVGLKEEDTVDLLVELGARGSAKNRKDGKIVWGLMSLHPIDQKSPYNRKFKKENKRHIYVKEKYQDSICGNIYPNPEFEI